MYEFKWRCTINSLTLGLGVTQRRQTTRKGFELQCMPCQGNSYTTYRKSPKKESTPRKQNRTQRTSGRANDEKKNVEKGRRGLGGAEGGRDGGQRGHGW